MQSISEEQPWAERATEVVGNLRQASSALVPVLAARIKNAVQGVFEGEVTDAASTQWQLDMESRINAADHEAGHLLITLCREESFPHAVSAWRMPMDVLGAIKPFVRVSRGVMHANPSNEPWDGILLPEMSLGSKVPTVVLAKDPRRAPALTLSKEKKELTSRELVESALEDLAGLAAEEVEKKGRREPLRDIKVTYNEAKYFWGDVGYPARTIEHLTGRTDEAFLEMCLYDMYQSVVDFLNGPERRELLRVLSFYTLEKGGKWSSDLTPDIKKYAEQNGISPDRWIKLRQDFQGLTDTWVQRLPGLRLVQIEGPEQRLAAS